MHTGHGMKRVPEQAAELQSISPNALKHNSVTFKIKTIGIFVIEACICQFLPQSITPAELFVLVQNPKYCQGKGACVSHLLEKHWLGASYRSPIMRTIPISCQKWSKNTSQTFESSVRTYITIPDLQAAHTPGNSQGPWLGCVTCPLTVTDTVLLTLSEDGPHLAEMLTEKTSRDGIDL